ncbi:MAG: hypothetical protein QG620_822 [Patescibacteria group bacterium]|nr:hypothetical protein [Patescibacteria group bacterium]
MLKAIKLSIIIVAYKSGGHLERCVASLYQKLGDSFAWEIIIVNSDSEYDIHKAALDFSRIKVVNHRKNIGFGPGANLGAKSAEGDFLLMLNPDTEINGENIGDVLEEFLRDENVGVIGGGIIDDAGGKQAWSAGRELSFYDLFRNNFGISRSRPIWNSSRKINCDWVAGTALFIRRDLFERLGGFDENFFMYFEDMDLCRRARQVGNRVRYFPGFKVFHSGGKSYEGKKLQKKHYYDSMEKYFKKNKSRWQWLVLRLVRKVFFNN